MEQLLEENVWGPDAWARAQRVDGLGVVCTLRLTPQSEGLRTVVRLPRDLAPTTRLADVVSTAGPTGEDGTAPEASRVHFEGPDLLVSGTKGVPVEVTLGWV